MDALTQNKSSSSYVTVDNPDKILTAIYLIMNFQEKSCRYAYKLYVKNVYQEYKVKTLANSCQQVVLKVFCG